MPNTFFDNPPVLQGDERTQLQQLYNYLGIMSAKLNEAMTEVETQSAGAQVTAVSQTTQTTGGGSGKTGGSSETTEIGDVPRLNEKGEMINDNWHTLDGRKLSGEPTKSGIYVRNGKKVIVK